MTQISFKGAELPAVCYAEVRNVGAPSVTYDTTQVLGKAGAVVLGSYVGPRQLTVRIWLDAEALAFSNKTMTSAKREVEEWLSVGSTGTLVLPGRGELEYDDSVAYSPAAVIKCWLLVKRPQGGLARRGLHSVRPDGIGA